MELIRRRLFQRLLLCVLVCKVTCDQEREYCSNETMEVECTGAQKVWIVDAVYGVIELGNCNPAHSGNPCFKQVTEFLQHRCEDVAECSVTVHDIHQYVADNLGSLSGTREDCDMADRENQFLKMDYECVHEVPDDDTWEQPEVEISAGAAGLYYAMTVRIATLTAAMLTLYYGLI